MPLTTSKATDADKKNVILKTLGPEALASANVLVARDDLGNITAAACGIAPIAGDTAMLGQFVFPSGGVTVRANLGAFRTLLKAHVTEAIELGFTYGEAIVSDVKVVRFVERQFGVKAEVIGTADGKPSVWKFTIVLADFLKVL